MTDVQVVALAGVETIWLRFPSIAARVTLTRDEAIELAQCITECAAPDLVDVP